MNRNQCSSSENACNCEWSQKRLTIDAARLLTNLAGECSGELIRFFSLRISCTFPPLLSHSTLRSSTFRFWWAEAASSLKVKAETVRVRMWDTLKMFLRTVSRQAAVSYLTVSFSAIISDLLTLEMGHCRRKVTLWWICLSKSICVGFRKKKPLFLMSPPRFKTNLQIIKIDFV